MNKKFIYAGVISAMIFWATEPAITTEVQVNTYNQLAAEIQAQTTGESTISITANLDNIGGIYDLNIGGENVTINGNNHWLSAHGFRGFTVEEGHALTINDIWDKTANHGFYNFGAKNNADGNGAAINNLGGTVTINGTLFNADSTNNNSNGGAIYNGGSMAISDSKFVNSGKASSAKGRPQNGGGIYNDGETMSIENSEFVGSNASFAGGAIYNNGTITSITGKFDQNQTLSGNSQGGAIYNADGKEIGSIGDANSTFTNNRAYTGGAIANHGTINSINGQFTNNSTWGNATYAEQGGAIHNADTGVITTINGTFSGNTAHNSHANPTKGGAINNDGQIGTIDASFDHNTAQNGGAIYNNGTLTSVDGTFTQNGKNTAGTVVTQNGGAIYNNEQITSITGEFTQNAVKTDGGAIYNNGTISTVTGAFSANQTYGGNSQGGAIYNAAGKEIGSIGDANSTFSNNNSYTGGAIANDGTVTSVNGEFTNNSTWGNSSTQERGGAIQNGNTGNITTINGTFTSNSAKVKGGAINNDGQLATIDASFTNNTAQNGGAVYNNGTLTSVGGTFTQNGKNAAGTLATTNGGAIYNNSQLSTINGTFTQNAATLNGGAIYNNGSTSQTVSISGVFDGNTTHNSGTEFNYGGGAIYNNGSISIANQNESTRTEFKNNSTTNWGGAIYNSQSAANTTIDADFSNNHADWGGGAIANRSAISSIKGTFSGNSANMGAAIYSGGTEITTIEGTFSENEANYSGGAIEIAAGTIGTIQNSSFTNNSSVANGGAIDVSSGTTINSITGTSFSENAAKGGGAINNQGTIGSINGDFTGNTAEYYGGAISNMGTLTLDSTQKDIIFSGNTVTTGISGLHIGADVATFANSTLNIAGTDADHKVSFQSGNDTQSSIYGQGAINHTSAGTVEILNNQLSHHYTGTYTQSGSGTTRLDNSNMFYNFDIQSGTLDVENQSLVVIDDTTKQKIHDGANVILGNNGMLWVESGSNQAIKKDVNLDISETGVIYINTGEVVVDANDDWKGRILNEASGKLTLDGINNANTALNYTQSNSGTLNLVNQSDFIYGNDSFKVNGGNVILNNSRLSFAPEAISGFSASNINMENNSTLNLLNGKADNLSIENLNVTDTNNIAVDVSSKGGSLDLITISDELTGEGTINISDYNFDSVPVDTNVNLQVFNIEGTASNVNFTATDKQYATPLGNYQLFSQGGGAYQARLVSFNPQIFRGQVATLAAYNNQLLVDDVLTNHINLHSEKIIANSKNANKYAAILPQFAPYQYSAEDGGLWVKSYATFEKLSMTNHLNVGNNAYGTLIGADMPAIDLSAGWRFIPTAYIGYNGANQHFNGVSMYQNGGQGGVMGTFLKNNFIGTILAYGGGYYNNMSVSGYRDETGNWFAGTAVKTSYNIRATEHFTLQPNAFVSYNIFGKQNWGSDFGAMSMNSGLLNGINVAPGLNLIYSRDSWSVYGTVQYMFNINDQISGRAGNVNLDSIEMRHGYIQYGAGVTKTWKDRLNSYFQITFRNGGRTGVGFQLGLQYLFDWTTPFKK